MLLRFPVRAVLAATVAAALLVSCAEAPPPVITPPPPAAPTVSLSPKLIELAAAYRGYMTRTTAITPDFADGAGVARSVQVGASYEPNQLVRGAIAYSAVVALQDKAFVEGVRVYAKDPVQRRQIAYEIMKDPAYAVGISGSDSAAGLVIATLGGDAQRLYDQGKAIKQAAYDIQKQPWSKAEVASRDVRLAGAKSVSATAMMGDVAETARLQQASTGVASLGLTATAAPPPYTPTVIRGLAIAALAVLGEATDANAEQLTALTHEPNIGMCMSTSKLNLYQCLAVSRPNYEDVFCLGQHVMMDTGRCVIRAAGLPEPYEARYIPDAKTIAKGMPTKKSPAVKKGKRKS
ncbi:MAG: hypothetical protein EPO51_09620 [Phenylobacterium sp.]|uniref:hypothetical protein n=1 Tax=Phenylobacterium sp. TaxID=1871053 RepID=UPI0012066A61|nr:hypothetical protein [Phenylobacterium sp.]TAJ72353.1 MAG: hypothetical protein EPO51_09620 [Phenylobacterium sp.]